MLRDIDSYTGENTKQGRERGEKFSDPAVTYQINGRDRIRMHTILSKFSQECTQK